MHIGQPPLTRDVLQLFQQGLALAAAQEFEQALHRYNQALQLKPDCPAIWHESGLALENLGNYQDAIAHYDQALQLESAETLADEIWHSRGNALQYGLGDYEAAILCYDRALKLQPQHYQVWQNRANALLYGLRRYEAAIVNYDQVLSIKLDHYLAWRNRGNALAALGCYQAAIISYDCALAIAPQDELASHARNGILSQVNWESSEPERVPATNPAWYGRGFSESNPMDLPSGGVSSLELGEETAPLNPTSSPGILSSPVTTPRCQSPILVIDAGSTRQEVILTHDLYVIGRDPRSDICLESRFVSRHHATLLRIPQADNYFGYQILDGNLNGTRSTNGLLINGHKHLTWNLAHGDVIWVAPDIHITYI
ncbi:MAG: tetratricopeptide repeat protein [Leptolyngbyaceae bacterium]|nr:tetratricopeptide repeat protein [Leptolyngbyaceae bacterium]